MFEACTVPELFKQQQGGLPAFSCRQTSALRAVAHSDTYQWLNAGHIKEQSKRFCVCLFFLLLLKAGLNQLVFLRKSRELTKQCYHTFWNESGSNSITMAAAASELQLSNEV